MNLRHTAVLTLVVWYLMVPPHRTCADCSRRVLKPDSTKSSLDRSEMVHSFDTDSHCNAALHAYLERERMWEGNGLPANRYVAKYGRCYASDDPRLKRK